MMRSRLKICFRKKNTSISKNGKAKLTLSFLLSVNKTRDFLPISVNFCNFLFCFCPLNFNLSSNFYFIFVVRFMLRLSRNGRNWKRSLVKAKRIGDVSPLVKADAKNAELIPRGFARLLDHSSDSLRHIQWLWKKDILGQDSFLIGPPGPRKRWLALASAELSNREVEYLSLSRDTTETDIKPEL